MEFQRGERQIQRTKKLLEDAFVQLSGEKSYDMITINDIIQRANVGRSTFYRHFETKADILLSLHEGIFSRFQLSLCSAANWLADRPSPQLVTFLEQVQQHESVGTVSLYKFGKDVDYIVRRIDQLLANLFEASLHASFTDARSTIPFSVLARAIAGVYRYVITAWFMEPRSLPAQEIATYIHRLARATIQEAIDDRHGTTT